MSNWKGTSKKRKRPGAAASSPAAFKSPAGRVHLILHKDATGHVAAASLSAPLFGESWQNTLATSSANTALRTLGETPSKSRVVHLAQEAMDALSKFTSGLMSQPGAPEVACVQGCAHCCHQSVGATPIEAIAIADYLRNNFTPDEMAALAVRVRTARERTAELSAQQRFSPEYPCPLLVEGSCSVYPVRPLTCRATNSLSAAECHDNLYDPEARTRYLSSGKGPDSLLGPYRASHALSAGLQLCLSEVYGLDMQPLDLTRALDELLHKPELAGAWLETGRGLEAARGGNASGNEHLRSVAGVT